MLKVRQIKSRAKKKLLEYFDRFLVFCIRARIEQDAWNETIIAIEAESIEEIKEELNIKNSRTLKLIEEMREAVKKEQEAYAKYQEDENFHDEYIKANHEAAAKILAVYEVLKERKLKEFVYPR